MDQAVARCVTGGFAFAGQSCISVQRIFVERRVCEGFLGKLAAAVQKLRVGDPVDESTDVGPMIRLADAERAEQWIAEAVARGCEGGLRRQAQRDVLAPTVLTGTSGDATRELRRRSLRQWSPWKPMTISARPLRG